MKDLPVRTLIAVLLIGLLCLVAWFGGWVQAAVHDLCQKRNSPRRASANSARRLNVRRNV